MRLKKRKHRKSAKLPWCHNIKLSFWSWSFVFLSFWFVIFLSFWHVFLSWSLFVFVLKSNRGGLKTVPWKSDLFQFSFLGLDDCFHCRLWPEFIVKIFLIKIYQSTTRCPLLREIHKDFDNRIPIKGILAFQTFIFMELSGSAHLHFTKYFLRLVQC